MYSLMAVIAATAAFVPFLTETYLGDCGKNAGLLRIGLLSVAVLLIVCALLSPTDVDWRPVSVVATALWIALLAYFSEGNNAKIFAAAVAVAAVPSAVYLIFGTDDRISEAFLLLPAVVCMAGLIIKRKSSDRYWDKRRYFVLFVPLLPLAVFCMAATVIDGFEAVLAGLTISVVLYYVSAISDRIVLDSTGVYGPERLWKIISSALGEGKTINVAMCQVGGNKEVNDDYGHREGTRVFQAFADCLKDETAGTDMIVGRYWASKYVVIQFGGDIKELEAVCMRMKDRCFHIADGHPYELKPCCALNEVTEAESLGSLLDRIEKEYLYDYLHVD